ncbi:MAG: DUF4111 domain-containing protein [Proteobacteria bacterium]|nr:DUF4111 domain-containing protein [Pseudomonadota bacterium]
MVTTEQQQIEQCLDLLRQIFSKDLLGVYLFGSALIGGLQKYSDIDLFVVIKRSTTPEEKKLLAESLLKISGIYMKSPKFPIEMTLVVQSAVNPWQYPPQFDFQYGEWLRETFEAGKSEPWQTKEMPDLALIITQVLLSSKTLLGPAPDQLLTKVPYADFINAMSHELSSLMNSVQTDTRNVLLTLARIWRTLETDTISSKPVAADWVISRLPNQYQIVLQRAKAICIGDEKEQWDDLSSLIAPAADFMFGKLKEKMAALQLSDHTHKSINIMNDNQN